jgi:osmotically-inducible protein OsmY
MQDVAAALRSNLTTKGLSVAVQILDGTVLLTGRVATFYQKQMAQAVAMRAMGERLKQFDLKNEIVVD